MGKIIPFCGSSSFDNTGWCLFFSENISLDILQFFNCEAFITVHSLFPFFFNCEAFE